MRYLRCQHENETGAKFCEECAAPLTRACARCGGSTGHRWGARLAQPDLRRVADALGAQLRIES